MLLSRSFALATLSFSCFLASLSCFVSRRSGTSALALDPIPRNERSGLLLRWLREEYTCAFCLPVGDAGPLVPPAESTCRRVVGDGDSGPRDSFVLAFPMLQTYDPEYRINGTSRTEGYRLRGYQRDDGGGGRETRDSTWSRRYYAAVSRQAWGRLRICRSRLSLN